jgi:hypothetical protein
MQASKPVISVIPQTLTRIETIYPLAIVAMDESNLPSVPTTGEGVLIR